VSEAQRLIRDARVAIPTRRYRLDGIGNAERFVDEHGEDVRYLPAEKQWVVWDGKRWVRDQGDIAVTALAKHTAASIYAAADTITLGLQLEAERQGGYDGPAPAEFGSHERRLRSLLRHAKQTASAHGLRDMLSLAQSEAGLAIQPGDLDAHPCLLNTQTGIVDLRTGKQRPHDRQALCANITRCGYAADAPAPFWDAFVSTIFCGDRDLIRYVQHLIGLSISANPGERILAIPYGSGGNGKSTFLETLARSLGGYATVGNAEALLAPRRDSGPDEDLADLCGKRLVICGEPPDAKLNPSRIKRLTGGDSITTHRKYQHIFTFSPTHTIWLATNTRPPIPEHTDAVWDRLKLIPCEHRFEQPLNRTEVDEMFAAEAEGILAWAILGAVEYHRHGLSEPSAVTVRTREYRDEEDLIGQFVADRLELHDDSRAESGAVYIAYQRWCQDCGHTPTTSAWLSRELIERYGLIPKPSNGRRYLVGVSIPPQGQQ
jgi:putative DNA primase/helicase